MLARVLTVILATISVAAAQDDVRVAKPKDCYLFSWGKGANWLTQISIEFKLSYLNSKQPFVDDRFFEPTAKALGWIDREKEPAITTIATVDGRRVVRIVYPEKGSFGKTIGLIMLAIETARDSEWFAPFFTAQPELFSDQFVSGKDITFGYIATLEYSGTGALRTHHLFNLRGAHPKLIRTMHAGRVDRTNYKSESEYQQALKVFDEESDLFSGILKPQKASKSKRSK